MAKSKEEIIYDIENNLVDPTTNKITGERVKARLLDMVDAMGTGGGQWEYWGIVPETNMNAVSMLLPLSTLFRGEVDGEVMVLPSGLRTQLGISVPEAVAVESSVEIVFPAADFKTVGELLHAMLVDFDAAGLVPITKEEFYTI